MSEWDDYRIGIARRLAELAAQGCAVKIVHGTMTPAVLSTLSASPHIQVRALDDADALPGYLHSKYFLIKERNVGRVYTGSPNWDSSSDGHRRRGTSDHPGVVHRDRTAAAECHHDECRPQLTRPALGHVHRVLIRVGPREVLDDVTGRDQ